MIEPSDAAQIILEPRAEIVLVCAIIAAMVVFLDHAIRGIIASIKEFKRDERAAKWILRSRQPWWLRDGSGDEPDRRGEPGQSSADDD